MCKKQFAIFLMICFCGALQAISFLSETPVIDGDLSDKVWKKLPWKDSFFVLGKNEPATVQTRFKTFNDGKYLYVLNGTLAEEEILKIAESIPFE